MFRNNAECKFVCFFCRVCGDLRTPSSDWRIVCRPQNKLLWGLPAIVQPVPIRARVLSSPQYLQQQEKKKADKLVLSMWFILATQLPTSAFNIAEKAHEVIMKWPPSLAQRLCTIAVATIIVPIKKFVSIKIKKNTNVHSRWYLRTTAKLSLSRWQC